MKHTRNGEPIDLIWVLMDSTHPRIAELLTVAELAHRERVPNSRLSVNRFSRTQALVKIAISEDAFRARLPAKIEEAIIRVYTEDDHDDALALVRIDDPAPAITIKAILDLGGNTNEGLLVRAVAVPWFEVLKIIQRDPASIHQIDWRTWEEIIAGAYTQDGFEVILTPRSGDGGKDIIATKRGVGSIRIFDQVKAYKPPHLVSADEVRAMLGVITAHQNVSKGIISTTSEFAPRVMDDLAIAAHIPYRLELKPRDRLLEWLAGLSSEPS